MNFGPQHYVPVLKVKRGEKRALRSIAPSFQQRITPLLEIVERKGDPAPTIDAHLATALKDLADSVRPYPRCFLDTRELAPDGPTVAAELFAQASAANILFTPVTGISRTADVAAALAYQTHGIAIRLTRAEMEAGGLAICLRAFMSNHSLDPGQTDLIMDLGPVDDMVADGVVAMMDAFLAGVPDHGSWRTFTISACAFPSSMGGVEKHSFDLVERVEWVAWQDALHGQRGSLARLPTFSDCAIQHSKGVEGYDPRTMPVSASIRYALRDRWLLVKGESTRRTAPSVQFPQLATKLVYGTSGCTSLVQPTVKAAG